MSKDIWENPLQRFGFVVVNVIAGEEVAGDRELFFGPLHPNDVWVNVPAGWRMAKLMAHLGLYESAKAAERDGFMADWFIPNGFTDVMNIGKAKHRVTILQTGTIS